MYGWGRFTGSTRIVVSSSQDEARVWREIEEYVMKRCLVKTSLSRIACWKRRSFLDNEEALPNLFFFIFCALALPYLNVYKFARFFNIGLITGKGVIDTCGSRRGK